VVTKPIEGGFYLYEIPVAHRTLGHQPVAVSLFNAAGHLIARGELQLPSHAAIESMIDVTTRHSEGFPLMRVPNQALRRPPTPLRRTPRKRPHARR
jgi:hypothetical protein